MRPLRDREPSVSPARRSDSDRYDSGTPFPRRSRAAARAAGGSPPARGFDGGASLLDWGPSLPGEEDYGYGEAADARYYEDGDGYDSAGDGYDDRHGGHDYDSAGRHGRSPRRSYAIPRGDVRSTDVAARSREYRREEADRASRERRYRGGVRRRAGSRTERRAAFGANGLAAATFRETHSAFPRRDARVVFRRREAPRRARVLQPHLLRAEVRPRRGARRVDVRAERRRRVRAGAPQRGAAPRAHGGPVRGAVRHGLRAEARLRVPQDAGRGRRLLQARQPGRRLGHGGAARGSREARGHQGARPGEPRAEPARGGAFEREHGEEARETPARRGRRRREPTREGVPVARGRPRPAEPGEEPGAVQARAHVVVRQAAHPETRPRAAQEGAPGASEDARRVEGARGGGGGVRGGARG